MTNKKRVNLEIFRSEKFLKWVKETPEEILVEMMKDAMAEVTQETCMETLKEGDCDLNLTGKCKKCYDYLAEQFIRNYIDGKNMFTVMDDIKSGKFYNTWKGFLCGVNYVVEDGGKFHGSIGRGIEDIINNSGISRKTWIKFLDYYFLGR